MKYLRVKDITKIGRGASPRPIDNPLFFDDENGEFAWVRISDVTSSNKYLLKTDEKLSELGSKFSVKLTKPTLFLSIAGSVGKPCINKIKVCIHDGFIYLKKPKYNIDYLYWFFNNPSLYEGKGKVGTQLNLNSETVGGLFVPHISYEQQTALANYLDYHTTKLDKEISLLEQKVEKLDEYKQALIYETVTKGLDKNVPMKDSGIEWIGMIPVRWEVKRVSDFFNSPKTITNPGRTDVLSLTLNGVIEKDIENNKGLNPESYDTYQIFKKNDLVFKLIDLANYQTSRVGRVWKDGIMSSAYIRLSKKKNTNIDYFFYQFFDLYKRAIFNMLGGNGVRSAINRGDLLKLSVVIPPQIEQQQIAKYLDEQYSKIDKKKDLINKKIELLKEYKQSLIYESVTGKINI